MAPGRIPSRPPFSLVPFSAAGINNGGGGASVEADAGVDVDVSSTVEVVGGRRVPVAAAFACRAAARSALALCLTSFASAFSE